MIFDLASDFSAALAAMPEAHPRQRILHLLEEAIRRDVHFIDRHPTTLFQCLWNTCWWYDSAEAATHYRGVDSIWAPADAPWLRSGPKLCELLERWRSEAGSSDPGTRGAARAWVRSLRPPRPPLGGPLRMTLAGHKGGTLAVAWSGDGTRIVSGGRDNLVKLWDSDDGSLLEAYTGHRWWIHDVAFSPDGTLIASASGDKTLRIWHASSGRLVTVLPDHKDGALSACFSPDGERLASGSGDGHLYIRSTNTWKLLAAQKIGQFSVEGCSYLPSGVHMAFYSSLSLALCDGTTGELCRQIRHPEPIRGVAVARDAALIAVASGQKVYLWNAVTGESLDVLEGHRKSVTAVRFLAGGSMLASTSDDKTVRLWNVESHWSLARWDSPAHFMGVPRGMPLAALEGTDDFINALDSCERGGSTWLVSGSGGQPARDPSIRVWDLSRPTAIPSEVARAEVLVGLSAAGDCVCTVGHGDTLRVWDAADGICLSGMRAEDARQVTKVCLSPDGRTLAIGAPDHAIKLCDAATGDSLHVLVGHGQRLRRLHFGSDGSTLCSTDDGGRLLVWDLHADPPRRVDGGGESDEELRLRPAPLLAPVWGESVVMSWSGEAMAWFPDPIQGPQFLPSMIEWAGQTLGELALIKLEQPAWQSLGDPATSSTGRARIHREGLATRYAASIRGWLSYPRRLKWAWHRYHFRGNANAAAMAIEYRHKASVRRFCRRCRL